MMQYSLLNQLYINKQKENWKVKIRISRMSDAINSKIMKLLGAQRSRPSCANRKSEWKRICFPNTTK